MSYQIILVYTISPKTNLGNLMLLMGWSGMSPNFNLGTLSHIKEIHMACVHHFPTSQVHLQHQPHRMQDIMLIILHLLLILPCKGVSAHHAHQMQHLLPNHRIKIQHKEICTFPFLPLHKITLHTNEMKVLIFSILSFLSSDNHSNNQNKKKWKNK